jgi:hypothetical protein
VLKIQVFDPPMCCPTGACGPTIDPALLEAHEALLRIQAEFDGGVKVERYALGQQPAKFMQEPEVATRLKAHGVPILPVTVVDGRAVKERSYPAYEELRGWVEAVVQAGPREAR